MRRFTPHVLFFVILSITVILAFATNSGSLGIVLGILTAYAMDPVIVIGGLAIGALNRSQAKLILFTVAFGIVASIVIANLDSSLGAGLTPGKIFLRCVATLAWAYLANIFKLRRTPDIEREIHSDNPMDVSPVLSFRDGKSAFDFACQYMTCSLAEGSILPGLVVDSRKEMGTAAAVKVQPDGSQIAVVRIASDDGGFSVPAMTFGAKGPSLTPGQLVAWKAVKYMPQMGQDADDKRLGWVGLIMGTLKNEYQDNAWVGGEEFVTD